jgi:hypothetical protein
MLDARGSESPSARDLRDHLRRASEEMPRSESAASGQGRGRGGRPSVVLPGTNGPGNGGVTAARSAAPGRRAARAVAPPAAPGRHVAAARPPPVRGAPRRRPEPPPLRDPAATEPASQSAAKLCSAAGGVAPLPRHHPSGARCDRRAVAHGLTENAMWRQIVRRETTSLLRLEIHQAPAVIFAAPNKSPARIQTNKLIPSNSSAPRRTQLRLAQSFPINVVDSKRGGIRSPSAPF